LSAAPLSRTASSAALMGTSTNAEKGGVGRTLTLDRLKALPGPGESGSGVIVRLEGRRPRGMISPDGR
jgi:hypothetical protein